MDLYKACPTYKLDNCPIYYILKNQIKHKPRAQYRINDLIILEQEITKLQSSQMKYISLLNNYQLLNDQYIQLSDKINNNNTLTMINTITETANQISLHISRKHDIIETINRLLCIIKTYLYSYLIKFQNKKIQIKKDVDDKHKIAEQEGYNKKDTIIYLCILNKLYDAEYICNRIQIALDYASSLEDIILN